MTARMNWFNYKDKQFQEKLLDFFGRNDVARTANIDRVVAQVVKDVRRSGFRAVNKYSKKYDGLKIAPDTVEVGPAEKERLIKEVPSEVIRALTKAAERIQAYHEKQLKAYVLNRQWQYTDKEGITLGQRLLPLKRVGIYVPGGKAPYPSTALMCAIPAKVAGVKEIYMASPQSGDKYNAATVAAASIAGVSKIYRMGGAQAIAAFAFGAAPIPRVDKIVGPGNVYVVSAKKQVYGDVDVDMFRGPSEVLIISDGNGVPSYITADILSQAEHDEDARTGFITTSMSEAKAVDKGVSSKLKTMERQKIAEKSIEKNGAIIVVRSLEQAADVVNIIAPEHLGLMVQEPQMLLDRIENAGAIFIGGYSPEALGDYMAGPNHVLPTGGAARFSGPLGVYDFFKKTSIVVSSRRGLASLSEDLEILAGLEGMSAHADSIKIRV